MRFVGPSAAHHAAQPWSGVGTGMVAFEPGAAAATRPRPCCPAALQAVSLIKEADALAITEHGQFYRDAETCKARKAGA